jgi:hypothetical protein
VWLEALAWSCGWLVGCQHVGMSCALLICGWCARREDGVAGSSSAALWPSIANTCGSELCGNLCVHQSSLPSWAVFGTAVLANCMNELCSLSPLLNVP